MDLIKLYAFLSLCMKKTVTFVSFENIVGQIYISISLNKDKFDNKLNQWGN